MTVFYTASWFGKKKYQKEFAPKLQKEHSEKFKDKFAAFRTILEIIE